MAAPSPSLWKQLFDALEQRLGPAINDLAKSDDMATLAALGQRSRSELDRRLEQVSRRTLHRLNMPAGSDVNRLLEHIARLEREVRDLRHQITDRENAEFLATLAERHEAGRHTATAKKTAGTKTTGKRAAGTTKKPPAA